MKLSFIHYFIVASDLLHLFPRVYMMIIPHIARFAAFVFVLAPIAYAAGCSESPESATPPASQAQVRVATFNVHRLFDTVCDSKNCGVKGNYEPLPSKEEYDAQIADIARSIRTIDADIVLLQEIEKESGVVDLQNALSIYPAYAFGECGYSASLDVAILTRGTIDAVETYRSGYSYTDPSGKPRPLSRELIRADIDLNGIKISAFTTHLISHRSDPTAHADAPKPPTLNKSSPNSPHKTLSDSSSLAATSTTHPPTPPSSTSKKTAYSSATQKTSHPPRSTPGATKSPSTTSSTTPHFHLTGQKPHASATTTPPPASAPATTAHSNPPTHSPSTI